MTIRAFLVLICVVASSCAVVGVTRLTSPLPPRELGCQLRVFLTEKAIRRQYEVVCLIDARTGISNFADRSASGAIDSARPKACECGTDAIIVDSVGSQTVGESYNSQGTAVVRAIRFLSEAEKPAK
jgi:hypothetical protein